VSAADVTIYKELPLRVEFDYQPAEPAERGPEAQYPGCAESVDVTRVLLGDIDVTATLTAEEIEEIVSEILGQQAEPDIPDRDDGWQMRREAW
jgi:hypothetical protein